MQKAVGSLWVIGLLVCLPPRTRNAIAFAPRYQI
jgi:hypothetical protein